MTEKKRDWRLVISSIAMAITAITCVVEGIYDGGTSASAIGMLLCAVVIYASCVTAVKKKRND